MLRASWRGMLVALLARRLLVPSNVAAFSSVPNVFSGRLLFKNQHSSSFPTLLSAKNNNNNVRSLGSSSSTKQKKTKGPKRLSKKARKRREQLKNERRRHYRQQQQKLCRQKNLHAAGKMKRILSATDFWFSKNNLKHDGHLLEQLRLYRGYIPFTALLEFPKFQHWVDLKIMYKAYTCSAAEKRYHVIIDKDLIEYGKQEMKRQKVRVAKEERRRKERERQRRKRDRQRKREYAQLCQERYEIVYNKVRPLILEETKEWLREERAKQQASNEPIPEGEEYEDPDTLTLEDIDDEEVYDTIFNVDVYQEEYWDFLHPKQEYDDDDEDYDDDDDYWGSDRVVWGGTDGGRDYATTSKDDNGFLGDAINSDADEADRKSDNLSDKFDFDPLLEEEADASSGSSDSGNKEDTLTDVVQEEETKEDVVTDKNKADDGPVDLSHALLRHKRVDLAYLHELSEEATTEYQMMELDVDGWYYGARQYGLWDIDDIYELESREETGQAKGKKPKQMRTYETTRQIMLIRDPKKLKSFCDMLLGSIGKTAKVHGNDPNAAAVGFDIEYCTLELDIRGTLPAMLQLASPDENSPIGLIWLDKFPDHGRNMIGKPEYEPLLRILADPQIRKVGVGASKDVNHLAEWWGVNDRKHLHYFFASITDLEKKDGVHDQSLAEMCEAVLGKKLPKIKQNMTKKQKKRKKQGRSTPTSHWRTSTITKQMKEYAANDVACSIDVWMELNEKEEESS